MMKRTGMVFALVTLAAAFSATQAQDKVVKLAPDQTFRFKANAYGCLSRDKLDAADQHALAGEQGKMQELFNAYQCLLTPENDEFRIIRVVGHAIEFQNAGNRDPNGLWTSDRFIKQY
ncbi:hypothetical protein KQH49_13975 [Mycetohabitans sp. B5]|uniref:Beta/gamma crystallin n=1 Tax=Mycetohabitans endofungorum TaxID=417203 RepID=A0A2P5KD72_9BURK|nr:MULTISPECIES: hypothetical protein [Mycetohabitans]MCG1055974.1 hypothetical protein [Mycetohabitans sp. B5]PPB84659.1 hypothetical protein B0O95_10256 [Mycetohabitans endofungorum]